MTIKFADRMLQILMITGVMMTARQIFEADAVSPTPTFRCLRDVLNGIAFLVRGEGAPVASIPLKARRVAYLAKPDALELHAKRMLNRRKAGGAPRKKETSERIAFQEKKAIFKSREQEIAERAKRIAAIRARYKAQAGGALGVRGLWL